MNVTQVRDTLGALNQTTPGWFHAALAANWLAGLPILEISDLLPDGGPALVAGDTKSLAAAERAAGTLDRVGTGGWARWANDTGGGTWAVTADDTHLAVAVTAWPPSDNPANPPIRGLLITLVDDTGHVSALARWTEGDPVDSAVEQTLRAAHNDATGPTPP